MQFEFLPAEFGLREAVAVPQLGKSPLVKCHGTQGRLYGPCLHKNIGPIRPYLARRHHFNSVKNSHHAFTSFLYDVCVCASGFIHEARAAWFQWIRAPKEKNFGLRLGVTGAICSHMAREFSSFNAFKFIVKASYLVVRVSPLSRCGHC